MQPASKAGIRAQPLATPQDGPSAPGGHRPAGAAVIGGGPAGLMAAEVLVAGGAAVDVYDRMPSIGRKFLMAGKGGLNLTHSEPRARFLSRYGAAREQLV